MTRGRRPRRSVAHVIVLSDKGLLILVIVCGLLGLESGLGEGLGGRVVNADPTRAAAPSVDDCGGVDLLVVILLNTREVTNAKKVSLSLERENRDAS